MTYEIEVQVHEKIVLPSILKQQQVKYTGGPSQIGSDTNFTTKQFWCRDILINLFKALIFYVCLFMQNSSLLFSSCHLELDISKNSQIFAIYFEK